MRTASLVLLAAVLIVVALAPMAAAESSKVKICHIPPGDPANFHTITVSEKALQAHLAHGDFPGSCFANAEALCDDGNACTIDAMDEETETCLIDHPPVDCDDGLLCTTDSCDPASGCQYAPIVCDDGDLCTVNACNPFDGECIATPIDCGPLGVCLADTGLCDYPCDGITCDPIDQCHEAGQCVLPGECVDGAPVADGTPCDDGNPSTGNDRCSAGVCSGEPLVTCPCWDEELLAGLRYPAGDGLDSLACNLDYSVSNPEGTQGVINHDIWMIRRDFEGSIVYWTEILTTQFYYHATTGPDCKIRDYCVDGDCLGTPTGGIGASNITLEELEVCEQLLAEAGAARGFSCFD